MSHQEMQNKEIIVIGAGIAGLLCANRLQQTGRQVLVLEKSNCVGGRMGNCRLSEGSADHGVQFFTVRDLRFQMLVDQWLEANICKTWFVSDGNELGAQGYVRYCGTNAMTDAPEHLAQTLDVKTNMPVQKVSYDGNLWTIWINDIATYTTEALFITAPLPQSLEMLEAGNAELEISIHDELKGIRYTKGIVLTAVLDGPAEISKHGGLYLRKDTITWLADNQAKGVSPEIPTLTIHANSEFSKKHWHSEDTICASLLIEAAQPFIHANITEWHCHRWAYAFPLTTWHDLFFQDYKRNLFLAGDAFGGPRVEGAALSGIQAADEFLTESVME